MVRKFREAFFGYNYSINSAVEVISRDGDVGTKSLAPTSTTRSTLSPLSQLDFY
jgi:hypothetical protein